MGQVSNLEDIQKRLDEAAHQIDVLFDGLTKEGLSPIEIKVKGIASQVQRAITVVRRDIDRMQNYSVLRGTPDYNRYLDARQIEEQLLDAKALIQRHESLLRKMKSREAKLIEMVNSLHAQAHEVKTNVPQRKQGSRR